VSDLENRSYPEPAPRNLTVVPEDAELAPLDTAFEIALDDEPDGPAAPVHEPGGLPMLPEPGTRLPVIPSHMRTVATARSALARQSSQVCHWCAFHGVRSPWYALKLLWYALLGAPRLLGRQLRWWWVAEASRRMRDADSDQWLKLHVHARQVRRTRGLLLLAELGALALAGSLLAVLAPWWGEALAAAAAVPAFAVVGRPEGKAIITPASTSPRFRILNADIVLRAYYAAGLGHADKPGQQITFAPPGMSRDGDGSRVLVDLPYGKGLDDAVKSKGAIASGLDVTVSQVFIHRDPTSHRRHVLWVADRDPLAVPVGRTPLLACKQTDIWKPAPFGLDERGALVTVPLMWNSVLVGALPRQGKTFSARLLALYAALDPYVQLSVFDGKGSPDWRAFAQVAESYAFGLTPTKDGLPPEILRDELDAVRVDVQDRYNRLSELAAERPDLCPEGKLTRELARDPRFAMPVRLIVIDEVQEYFDLGDISKDIASLLVFMAKVAPGAGVSVLAATQKPSGIGGSGTIAQQFTSFRDQLAIRFSLRTSSWQVSEMVLGQGAYSEGLDSSALLPQYKGVGILRGASDASPTTRTFLADGEDTAKILTAARVLRERAGTLSGMAAGESAAAASRDVLGDLLAVFEGDPGLHWTEAAERLARRFPDRWGDVSGDALSAQCRALGVPSVDVKRSGTTLKGCRREHVEAAAGSR
jgi:S-DNA-T family DNA segregation ATPase FtsK/SpoIIIE